jgi:hypothetical protein
MQAASTRKSGNVFFPTTTIFSFGGRGELLLPPSLPPSLFIGVALLMMLMLLNDVVVNENVFCYHETLL